MKSQQSKNNINTNTNTESLQVMPDLNHLKQFVGCLLTSLKKQSQRSFNFSNKEKAALLSNNNPLGNMLLKQKQLITFAEYTQYKDLIQMQVIKKLQKLLEKIQLSIKQVQRLERISKRQGSKDKKQKQQNSKNQQKQKKQERRQQDPKYEQFRKELEEILKSQLLLIMNYKLDIHSKNIERWSIILQKIKNVNNDRSSRENIQNKKTQTQTIQQRKQKMIEKEIDQLFQ